MEEKKLIGNFQLIMVFVAFTCGVNTVAMGATIGFGLPFLKGLAAILVGFAVLTVIAIVSALMGYRSRVGTDVIWSHAFGKKGFKIPSACIGICLAFWAIFDFWNVGAVVCYLFPERYAVLGFTLGIILITVVTIITSLKGIEGIAWLSTASIPIAVILFVIMTVVCCQKAGGFAGMMAYKPTAPITFGTGVNLFIGSWLNATVRFPDITVQAKHRAGVIWGAICAIAFVVLTALAGQFGAVGFAAASMAELCAAMGGALFIISSLFTIVAESNTTPTANLMYSTSLSEVTGKKRVIFAVLIPLIAGSVTYVIQFGTGVGIMSRLIDFIAIIFAPTMGVAIAEYWIIDRGIIDTSREPKAWKKSALISLVCGAVLCFFLTYYASNFFPAITTLVVTILLQVFLRKVVKMDSDGDFAEDAEKPQKQKSQEEDAVAL